MERNGTVFSNKNNYKMEKIIKFNMSNLKEMKDLLRSLERTNNFLHDAIDNLQSIEYELLEDTVNDDEYDFIYFTVERLTDLEFQLESRIESLESDIKLLEDQEG